MKFILYNIIKIKFIYYIYYIMKKCNIKNAVCLNNLKDQKSFLRDVNSVMKKNLQILKNYSYYYLKTDEEYSYNLLFQKVKNNLHITISDGEGWNDKIVCLKLIFCNPNKFFNTFKNSTIEKLNKGNCGKGKRKIMTGGYILNLANKLNDILNVEYSTLEDDSKIKIKNCDNGEYSISLKVIELLKYGKTWYERKGGYSLDDKNIYNLTKQVQDISLSNIINYANTNIYRRISEFKLKKEDVDKLYKILDKLNVGKNIKMKNLYLKAFSKNSNLTLCEQAHLYNMTMLLPIRKIAKENSNDIIHEKYNILQEFGKEHFNWSKSTRKNKKKKMSKKLK